MSSVLRARCARPSKRISPCVLHHRAQGAQGRRLARAVSAEQRGDRALLDREIDAVQHARLAVGRVQAFALQAALVQGRPSPLPGARCTSSGEPCATRRPKLSATTRSEMLITRLMWCSTSSTVSEKRRAAPASARRAAPPPRGSGRSPARRAGAARLAGERARQLDALLRAEGQVGDRRGGKLLEPERGDQRARLLARRAVVARGDAAGAARWRRSRRACGCGGRP